MLSMAHTVSTVRRPAPRKMFSAQGQSVDAIGKELSDRQIARDFGRDIERALGLAGWTSESARLELGYANQSPISKLINPEQASALAKLLTLPRMRAAFVEVQASRCAEWSRSVKLERRQA